MKALTTAIAVIVAAAALPAAATDFWITASPIYAAPGPANLTETVCGLAGTHLERTIWVETDPSATLRNFSLDLTSSADAVLEFRGIVVNNDDPISGGVRFEFVQDTGPNRVSEQPITSAPDEIDEFQGFTISPSSTAVGLHPGNADDASLPAWKLAIFSVELTSTGLTQLQISVGDNGIKNDGSATTFLISPYADTLTVHDVPADFNQDRAVDGLDLAVWEANYGTLHSGDCTSGDADSDGDVDGDDLALLQRSTNRYPVAPVAAVVPEPLAALLTLVGLWLTFATPQRRRLQIRAGRFVQLPAIFAIAVLMSASQRADAQQFVEWVGPDGSWSNETNWAPMVVPNEQLPFDSARISNGAVATINSPVPDIFQLDILEGAVAITDGSSLGVAGPTNVVGQDSILRIGGGASFLDAGGPVRLRQEGELQGAGLINGAVVNRGLLTPGSLSEPIADFFIDGPYSQRTDGTLELQIGGSDPGEFDRLFVSGPAALRGKLKLVLTNADLQGKEIQLLQFQDEPEGNFQAFTVSSPLNKCYVLDGTTFTLLTSECYDPGDMNLDNRVDSDDLSLFALAVANKEAYLDTMLADRNRYVDVACLGDVNLDGFFNFDDIESFASDAGLALPAVAAAIEAAMQAVPEPTSAALLLTSIGTAAMSRRRRVNPAS